MTRRQYNRLDLPKHKNLWIDVASGIFTLYIHDGARFPVSLTFPLRRIYDIYMDDGYLYILEGPDVLLAALDKALWENEGMNGFNWVNDDEDSLTVHCHADLPLNYRVELWGKLFGGFEWRLLNGYYEEVLSERASTFEEAKANCEKAVTAKLNSIFEYQREQYDLWKGNTPKDVDE